MSGAKELGAKTMLLSPFIWQTFRKSCIFDNGIKNEVEGYVWKPNDLSVLFGFCIYYFFLLIIFGSAPLPHTFWSSPKACLPAFRSTSKACPTFWSAFKACPHQLSG
jgi:hypothetical protein